MSIKMQDTSKNLKKNNLAIYSELLISIASSKCFEPNRIEMQLAEALDHLQEVKLIEIIDIKEIKNLLKKVKVKVILKKTTTKSENRSFSELLGSSKSLTISVYSY